ncbi:uncharacterized protein EI90DRAFT_3060708 [Cantharellus anzutake]|uniref:uncharacterized protein n=1 Tax=Cantharellus anzutake TaxID=1750568 RepID=UPI0019056C3D|nr:uncharacterized protein EI90DRAFT_3060708 [Cantharellus anzutake]KAF8330423.1 hypothetical protein EI90DRAFT_3060708 [Cantharellus anzutake]
MKQFCRPTAGRIPAGRSCCCCLRFLRIGIDANALLFTQGSAILSSRRDVPSTLFAQVLML